MPRAVEAAEPTFNTIIADLFLCIKLKLLFHRSQLFIFNINKYAMLEVRVGVVPWVLNTGYWSALVDTTDIFCYLFAHTQFYTYERKDKWWTRRESNPRPK